MESVTLLCEADLIARDACGPGLARFRELSALAGSSGLLPMTQSAALLAIAFSVRDRDFLLWALCGGLLPPYLSGAYLSRANLSGADLSRADLYGVIGYDAAL